MRCEVCGRRIIGSPFKAMIEGAKMLVCAECSKLGSVYWESRSEPRMKKVIRRLPKPVLVTSRRQPALPVEESLELVDNLGTQIRQAREKLELSHEDLGKKIMEKVSVLRKIESGKMVPDNLLTEKLQHALKIKLLVPVSNPKVPSKLVATRPSAPTLGDIAGVKEEEGKGKEKRGQSTKREP